MGTGRLWIGGVGKQGMTEYQQGYKQGCILCDIGANLLGYNPAFTLVSYGFHISAHRTPFVFTQC